MVASVSPTSMHATRLLIEGINLAKSRVIVEYGPGNGVITKELLKGMPDDAKLLAVEINKDFYNELRAIDDPRLIPVNGSAEDVAGIMRKHGLMQADVVISGIPFSLLKEPVRRAIVEATRNILDESGSFHVYQTSKLAKSLLEDYFYKIETTFVWKNIPPLFILRASLRRPVPHHPALHRHAVLMSGKAG